MRAPLRLAARRHRRRRGAAPGDDVFSPTSLGKIAARHARHQERARRRSHPVDDRRSPTSSPGRSARSRSTSCPRCRPTPTSRARCATRCCRASSPSATSSRATAARALILVFLADRGSIGQAPGELRVEDHIRAAAERELARLTIYYGGAPFAGARHLRRGAGRRAAPVAGGAAGAAPGGHPRLPRSGRASRSPSASVAFSVLVVLGGMGWWGEQFTVATLDAAGDPVRLGQLLRGARARALLPLARRPHRPPTPSASRCASSGRRWPSPPAPPRSASTRFVTTDVRPMRAFGIACGSGVLLCWLTSLTLVPAVVALWPRKAQQQVQLDRVGDCAGRAVALGAAPPPPALRRRAASLGALTVGPMLRVTRAHGAAAFFREGSEPWLAERFLDRALRRRRPSCRSWLTGDFDDPSTLRELARLEDFARSLPGVSQVAVGAAAAARWQPTPWAAAAVLPWKRSQAANLYLFLEGRGGHAPARHARAPRRRWCRCACAATPRRRWRRSSASPHDELHRAAAPAHASRTSPIGSPGRRAPPAARSGRASCCARSGRWRRPASPTRSGRAAAPRSSRTTSNGEEAPPMSGERARRDRAPRHRRARRLGRARGGAAQAPRAEDGALAYQFLATPPRRGARRLAVERAVPLLLARRRAARATGPTPSSCAPTLATLADDLFVHIAPSERPTLPLSARIAGEPILDRGFSRSVGDNQVALAHRHHRAACCC